MFILLACSSSKDSSLEDAIVRRHLRRSREHTARLGVLTAEVSVRNRDYRTKELRLLPYLHPLLQIESESN